MTWRRSWRPARVARRRKRGPWVRWGPRGNADPSIAPLAGPLAGPLGGARISVPALRPLLPWLWPHGAVVGWRCRRWAPGPGSSRDRRTGRYAHAGAPGEFGGLLAVLFGLRGGGTFGFSLGAGCLFLFGAHLAR